jgi:glutamyl-Q tRNA(Asp) synthetase
LSDAGALGFTDLVLGPQIPTVMPKNFVMKRKDGLIAYQLATAVDDIDEGYTHIIRGSDLLDSTFRQRAIHDALGKLSPRYGHLPLVTDSLGNKLSKQAGAQAVDVVRPVANLRLALDFLNQPSPPTAAKSISDVLNFAIEHWRLSQLN